MRKKKAKKAQQSGSTKVSMLRPTPDDWHPTLEGGFVTVSLYTNLPHQVALVSVWGGDDTGMERWFDGDDTGASRLYAQIISMAFVSKQNLADLGFTFC